MNKGVNVRISGKLLGFVEQQISPNGMYESASEYIRDLVRRDREKQEHLEWQQLARELSPGMHAGEAEFIPLDIDGVIAEAKKQKSTS
jgi:antitoxin ParD1/3/4